MICKSIVLFFLGLLLAMSCQQTADSDNNEKQQLALLRDIYIADALVLKQPSHLRDSLRNIYVQQIGEIHEMSTEQIDSIILNLQEDLINYKEISDSLMKDVDKKSEQLEKNPANSK